MAVEKPEGTIVLTSFIGGSSYFQVSEQGPSFCGEMLSENHSALRKDLVQGLGHIVIDTHVQLCRMKNVISFPFSLPWTPNVHSIEYYCLLKGRLNNYRTA